MAFVGLLCRVVLSSLLLCVCRIPQGSCDVPQFCDPTQFTQALDPPVPSRLPEQFSTTVQAVIAVGEDLDDTREITVREYFDGVGNRGRLEFAANGTWGYYIYDYNNAELFVIDASGCSVQKIDENNTIVMVTFGFSVEGGSPHIGTVSHFFQTDQGNFTFMGPETVRGIPCNRWQSCSVFADRSYTIDYYFSRTDTDWTSAYRDDPIPIMIIVNGTREDSDDNGSTSIREVKNIYTFVDFNGGQDSVQDDVFQVPTGLVCKDRISGLPLPSLPIYFTAFIEVVDENNRTVRIYKEYYDFKFKFFRVDYYNNDYQYGLPPGPFTYIQDFNLITQYSINRQYRNCSINRIESPLFDAVVVDGKVTLSSPTQFFLLLDTSEYSYEGVSTVRGVQVDSWITYTDFKELDSGANVSNTTHEMFFTRPKWSTGTHSSAPSSEPTLWRSRVTGIVTYINSTTNLTETQEFSVTYDYFAFNSGEPDLDVFDTSMCVPVGQFYTVVLLVPVEGVQVDFLLLPQNVRSAVADSTGVRPLQVGNIEVLDGNATYLTLSLYISNLSNISMETVSNPVSAYQAIVKLTNSAQKSDSKLDFDITISADGQKARPSLLTVRSENGTIYHGFIGGEDSDSDGGLSDGAIAGIAIWMLVVGLGIGVIGTLAILAIIPCIRKRSFTLGAVSYKKQEDEKVNIE